MPLSVACGSREIMVPRPAGSHLAAQALRREPKAGAPPTQARRKTGLVMARAVRIAHSRISKQRKLPLPGSGPRRTSPRKPRAERGTPSRTATQAGNGRPRADLAFAPTPACWRDSPGCPPAQPGPAPSPAGRAGGRRAGLTLSRAMLGSRHRGRPGAPGPAGPAGPRAGRLGCLTWVASPAAGIDFQPQTPGAASSYPIPQALSSAPSAGGFRRGCGPRPRHSL